MIVVSGTFMMTWSLDTGRLNVGCDRDICLFHINVSESTLFRNIFILSDFAVWLQEMDMFSFAIERESKRVCVDYSRPWMHGSLWTTSSIQEAVAPEKQPIKASIEESSDSDSDESLEINVLCDTYEKNASEIYKDFVDRTEAQVLEEMSAPQRSCLWLKARETCITASQFGAAVGNHP